MTELNGNESILAGQVTGVSSQLLRRISWRFNLLIDRRNSSLLRLACMYSLRLRIISSYSIKLKELTCRRSRSQVPRNHGIPVSFIVVAVRVIIHLTDSAQRFLPQCLSLSIRA